MGKCDLGSKESLTLVSFLTLLPILLFVVVVVQEVPHELWELMELEKLNLSLNSLKHLPPQLAMLSNLVVLNLWGNQVNLFLSEVHE